MLLHNTNYRISSCEVIHADQAKVRLLSGLLKELGSLDLMWAKSVDLMGSVKSCIEPRVKSLGSKRHDPSEWPFLGRSNFKIY